MNARKKKTKPQRKVGKIDTVEKLATVVSEGFAQVYDRMDKSFAQVYDRMDKSFAQVYDRMDKSFAQVYERVANGFAEVREQFDDVYTRFDKIDDRFGDVYARFDSVDSELSAIRREIGDIRVRVEHLEEQGVMQSGYAQEIDFILARLARIEKHLDIS